MKQLKESLLDDFDSIVEKSDINMYLSKFWNVWLKGMDKAGCDAMGKPLKIGDLVIGIAAYQPMPAIIVDIKNKKKLQFHKQVIARILKILKEK